MVRWRSKNKHHKDTCLQGIELSLLHIVLTTPHVLVGNTTERTRRLQLLYGYFTLPGTRLLDRCVVWWGSKDKHQKDTWLKERGLTSVSYFINCSTFSDEYNWGDLRYATVIWLHFYNRTRLLDWCVVWWGSKNKHLEDTCLKGVGWSVLTLY